MARFAIGDVQGCYVELRALLARLPFSADRDQLWFVGDLVNRGPQSLEVLRYVRSLGDNAVVVLGNHDLHLLALAAGRGRKRKALDTFDAVLEAPDRDRLLDWLLTRPLAHLDAASGDLLVHAGLVPQWSAQRAVELAHEVHTRLVDDAPALFDHMYGNGPDRWSDALEGYERARFVINVLTRLRFCTPDGRVDLKLKCAPQDAEKPFVPWFSVEGRASRGSRIVCGHWSALGFQRRKDLLALDSGCVWGGTLTAYSLDGPGERFSEACAAYQAIGSD